MLMSRRVPVFCKSVSRLAEAQQKIRNPVKGGRQGYIVKMDEDFDDLPLSKRIKVQPIEMNGGLSKKKNVIEDDSDDDVPLATKIRQQIKAQTLNSSSQLKKEDSLPVKVKKEVVKKEETKEPIAEKKVKVKKEKEDSAVKASKAKNEKDQQAAKKTKKENDEDESEEYYKWWEEEKNDHSIKWTTLEHNGVYFPPEYVPHNIKMKYEGKEIDLPPHAEEVASFYAALVGTDHSENEIFKANFFEDFRKTLVNTKYENVIVDLSKCDFSPMTIYFHALKEAKKNRSKEEKAKEKQEKLEIEKQFGFCYLNGRKEKVGNFRIEPPGLFRGRGKHPKAGKLKTRVQPEQVTINIGENATVPKPPAGHQWNEVIHDPTVSWLATWTENVNGNIKYVFLAAGSSLKGQSDFRKFEKARELKKYVESIRRKNAEELRDKEMLVRQRATALWLIDHLALRAGNEKGEDEADTVGCCSLRLEHVTLQPPKTVIFDFLGKDSIRYYNEVEVDEVIFKNLKIFMKPPKKPSDLIFDRLTTTTLNKFLNSLMPGLSAKVFRTFNASFTFQRELEKTTKDASIPEKILSYNRANREVAVLCNHQRSVPKTHSTSIERMKDKILTMKFTRWQVRNQIINQLDKKEIKQRPEICEIESDLDDHVIELKRQELDQKEKEKLEKLKEKNPDASPKKKSVSTLSLDKLEKQLVTITSRIQSAKTQMIDKDENKTTALGTSKVNYIDPRISASWCKKYEVPIEKIFNLSLRDKFKWAMEVDEDWEF